MHADDTNFLLSPYNTSLQNLTKDLDDWMCHVLSPVWFLFVFLMFIIISY